MRTVAGFPRATAVTSSEPVEPFSLVFDSGVPHWDDVSRTPEWEAKYRDFYGAQARRFVQEILKSAPGGFVDALFGELAHVKASIFRVPHQS